MVIWRFLCHCHWMCIGKAMLELKQVCKQYHVQQQTVSALNNINLSVNQGDIVGIIGKSGAGKSTLIRCINLLERPSQGEVWLDDVNLMTLSPAKLRKVRHSVGMIFQHFNLLDSRTVFGNIALPLELQGMKKQAIQEIVEPLLALVNLTDRCDYFPQQLSGGQKQRVAIARALATKPRLLLCDEATSALDPESTLSILTLLKQINQQMKLTIVMITHTMAVIKQCCDKVGIIDQGKLVEFGDVVHIFAEPQHTVTQRFIGQALHLVLPENLQQNIKTTPSAGLYPLVRLTFVNNSANTPLVTEIHQRFGVVVNILQADLEYIHGSNIGFMLCQLKGESAPIDKALAYLTTQSVKSEVLGYV